MKRIIWALSALGLAGAVAYSSLQPSLAPPDAYSIDKVLHLGGYGAMMLLWGLARSRNAPHIGWRIIGAGIFVGLGGVVELMQAQIPGRSGSAGDFLANSLGVALALGLLALRDRWRR